MGYYTTLDGTVKFSREISLEVLDKINELYEFSGSADEHGINFDYDEGKHYDLIPQAKELVKILASVGVTATGTIEAVGEEQPDIWRLNFKDGTVVQESVQMTWPDGTVYRG